MPERIDASVRKPKAADPEPVVDHGGCQARIEQLSSRDNAVLAIGKLRQAPFPPTQLELTVTIRVKTSCVAHGAEPGRQTAPGWGQM
jgi:hypothetical protein